MPTLQEKFNASKSALFTLTENFVYGQLTVNRPCIIDGQGATIFADSAPVVLIRARNVCLRNLHICIKNGKGIAISTNFLDTKLEDVEVNGVLEGFPNENPKFILPNLISLGSFKSGNLSSPNIFLKDIYSPAEVDLESNIDGVDIYPLKLNPGQNKLWITVNGVDEGTSIYGYIKVKLAKVTRRIWFSGEAKKDAPLVQDSLPPIKVNYEDRKEVQNGRFTIALQNSFLTRPFIFLLNDRNRVQDNNHFVYYENRRYGNGAVEISNDRVSIDLSKMPSVIKAIAFHYSFKNFSDDVFTLIQSETNQKCCFQLKFDRATIPCNDIKTSLALTFYKAKSGWKICFLGKCSSDSLEKICKKYGVSNFNLK